MFRTMSAVTPVSFQPDLVQKAKIKTKVYEVRSKHQKMWKKWVEYLYEEDLVQKPYAPLNPNSADLWPICLWNPVSRVSLDWKHEFCKSCLSDYIQGWVQNGKVEIRCPVLKWNNPLAENTIKQYLNKDQFTKFTTFKRCLEITSAYPKACFWYQCGVFQHYSPPAKPHTTTASRIVWKRCHEQLHEFSDICAEYNKRAACLAIQMCPKCNSFVQRTSSSDYKISNYLKWRKCSERFWIYCRQKYTSNHMNPLSPAVCQYLQKKKKTRLVSKMPALIEHSVPKILWIIGILLLASPIIALIVLPYTITKNMSTSYWNPVRSWSQKTLKLLFLCAIFLLLQACFPAMLLLTLMLYIYIFWKMKK